MSRRQRVTTALLLAPLPILALLFLPTPWLAALVAAVMLAGLWEWTAFAGLEDKTPRVLFLTANALMMAALVWGGGPSLFTLKLASLVGVVWWALVCLWLARPGFGQGDGQGAALHARHGRLDQGDIGTEQRGECVHARILREHPGRVNPQRCNTAFI